MYRKAFSLVELSIVLVILGLLVGGVLAGQSLIRASELRSVNADYQRHVTSVAAFRDKYLALPGDMANAVLFWGAQVGGLTNGRDATCAALTTASTGPATCNGDGDTLISTSAGRYETYRAWQHLANAGLVEGTYTGVASNGVGNTGYDTTAGLNVPRSKLSGGCFIIREYAPVLASSTLYFPGSYGNALWFGAQTGGTFNNNCGDPILKPEEAWNIDTKMDDGYPSTGKLVAPEALTACHTSTDPALAQYALSTSTAECSFMYKLGIGGR